MKKYSTDYFEKKYKILAEKLLQKEGFKDATAATRAEFGLPEDGLSSSPELAFFFIEKMTEDERQSLIFIAFIEAYAHKKKIAIVEELLRMNMTKSCKT